MPATRSKSKAQYPAGFRRLGAYQGIEEYELTKNGLRVLYKHDPTSPVVGIMVTYLVGSRHEAVGHTGATHILEHLMFKGSKNFSSKGGLGPLDLLEALGAHVNATTWLDRTNYYEVLPSEHFTYALELEADRMRNAIINEKGRQEEMPAVRSEYAFRTENDPMEFLEEKVWATAFMAHPYHHPVIGWLADIENVSIERLRKFYDTYYWPNNAVLTIVGNVERTEALKQVKRTFGQYSRSPHPIPAPYTVEPPQTGRRFVEVQRAGTKDIVCAAFKVPEATHADTPALIALASILAGGTTSRLHKALVEKKLATAVQASYLPFHDPSLFPIYATLSPGVRHERVEALMQETCTGLTKELVERGELERVLASVKTELAFARDGHYALLSVLNESISVGDWKYLLSLPERIATLSAGEVRDVAARYLTPTTVTVGYYRTQS